MKKRIVCCLMVAAMSVMIVGCGSENDSNNSTKSEANITSVEKVTTEELNTTEEVNTTEATNKLTVEKAYEGVNKYCHSTYDWSAAEENPDIMYVEKGEETETEYQIIFHSYTGAIVYFYVDKANGTTRIVEYVPTLDIEEEAGTINVNDYL